MIKSFLRKAFITCYELSIIKILSHIWVVFYITDRWYFIEKNNPVQFLRISQTSFPEECTNLIYTQSNFRFRFVKKNWTKKKMAYIKKEQTNKNHLIRHSSEIFINWVNVCIQLQRNILLINLIKKSIKYSRSSQWWKLKLNIYFVLYILLSDVITGYITIFGCYFYCIFWCFIAHWMTVAKCMTCLLFLVNFN